MYMYKGQVGLDKYAKPIRWVGFCSNATTLLLCTLLLGIVLLKFPAREKIVYVDRSATQSLQQVMQAVASKENLLVASKQDSNGMLFEQSKTSMPETDLSSNEVAEVRDYSMLPPSMFLEDLMSAKKTAKKLQLRGRDSRNPQRIIVDTFLEQQAALGVISGKGLEFDEPKYLTQYSQYLTSLEVLDYADIPAKKTVVSDTLVRTTGNLMNGDIYPENYIDTLFLTEVLEHVYNVHDAVENVYRLMKPCGHVLVTVPFIYRYHGDPVDYYRYTNQAISTLFTEAGFEEIMCERRGNIQTVLAAYYRLDITELHNYKDLVSKEQKPLPGLWSATVGVYRKSDGC